MRIFVYFSLDVTFATLKDDDANSGVSHFGHLLSLAERLRGQGISVWIDQHAIEGATQWSKEIVEAIKECKALIVLLSSAATASRNVVREVSLASEKNKEILPLVLEETELPSEFEYPLAGIQRTQYENFESILR